MDFRKSRFVSAIFAWLANLGNAKFWRVMLNLRGLGQKIGVAGGRSLRARVPPSWREAFLPFENLQASRRLNGAKHSPLGRHLAKSGVPRRKYLRPMRLDDFTMPDGLWRQCSFYTVVSKQYFSRPATFCKNCPSGLDGCFGSLILIFSGSSHWISISLCPSCVLMPTD